MERTQNSQWTWRQTVEIIQSKEHRQDRLHFSVQKSEQNTETSRTLWSCGTWGSGERKCSRSRKWEVTEPHMDFQLSLHLLWREYNKPTTWVSAHPESICLKMKISSTTVTKATFLNIAWSSQSLGKEVGQYCVQVKFQFWNAVRSH